MLNPGTSPRRLLSILLESAQDSFYKERCLGSSRGEGLKEARYEIV